MDTYVLLFRGVNVGGKNLLPMKELVAILEEKGFKNVKTYIQSGNVVVESKPFTPSKIVKWVLAHFGFSPEILVLRKSEFLSAVKKNPFHPNEGKFAHFYFCSATPKLDQTKLEQYIADTEEYKLVNKVFYLYAPKGIGRSKLVANIESCVGVPVTGRNLNTIKKLEEMIKNT